jgi:Flp pilus assembly protein CpaB
MLLQRSMVTPASGLSPQEAEVGVAVTSGQIPADGLAPGDTVQVLQLPDDNASRSSDTAQELTQARVFAVRPDPAQAGGTMLTLTVPAEQAALVATASGAGKIALIRVAPAS